jgi:hypothetical protein
MYARYFVSGFCKHFIIGLNSFKNLGVYAAECKNILPKDGLLAEHGLLEFEF